jgi:hypothetical protein
MATNRYNRQGAIDSSLTDMDDGAREAARNAAARRLALSSQNAELRARYDEVMNWINPPWDPNTKRADPRPEQQSARRGGRSKLHADWVLGAVVRWAVLQGGVSPRFRVDPPYIPPLLPSAPEADPNEVELERKRDELDRAAATDKASQMEQQTREWMEASNFHRTYLWACWSKEAFGKAIVKDGWDVDNNIPTWELMENPSQCYYAWTSRFGQRQLAWMVVADQMLPEEAEFRYGIELPRSQNGSVDMNAWTGSVPDENDLTLRPEQQTETDQYIWVEEMWELDRDDDGTYVTMDFIVAGRVMQSKTFPWKRLPFKVLETHHIPTYSHGKSVAELAISLNEAYDDTLDRQHQVIEFESGPRYKGLNMAMSDDEALQVPEPGYIMRLREGEDVQQIDTRVDFWPAQVHTEELRQAFHWATGLTPIAMGMSQNAQTSGRALTSEWKAVQLHLTERLVNMTPELRDVVLSWWDYAETYWPKAKKVAEGYRRFKVVWEPIDIRDTNERIVGIVQLYQADLMDPESAIQEAGYEDVPERVAKIRRYLTDPVWNPLRYQQMLLLKQLALQIEQAEMQNAAMKQQMAPQQQPTGPEGAPPVDETAAQGEVAAATAAQGPAGPVTEAMNQPGQVPGGIPLDTAMLSRSPMEGGMGTQIMARPGEAPAAGMAPTNGVAPR